MTDQSHDAFKEARLRDDELLAALEQEQTEHADPESNPYLEGFEEAEQNDQVSVKEKATAPKPSGRQGVVLGALALIVGLGASAWAAYSQQQAAQVRVDAGVAFDRVSTNVQALVAENVDLKSLLVAVEGRLEAAEEALNRIDTTSLENQINAVNASVEALDGMVQGQRALFETRIASVSDENRRLEQNLLSQQEAAVARIKQLMTQKLPTPTTPLTKPKSVNASPTIQPIFDLEGARFIATDRWGMTDNVVLKESITGDWITLEVGDQYKGWTLTRIEASKRVALVSKNGKTFALKQSAS